MIPGNFGMLTKRVLQTSDRMKTWENSILLPNRKTETYSFYH